MARVLAKDKDNKDMNGKQQLEQVFKRYDTNKDGKIGKTELKAMLGELGKTHEANKVMEEWDHNGDGALDETEMVKMQTVTSELTMLDNRSAVESAFKKFDSNGDGTISVQELAQAANISEALSEVIIKDVDKDGDGQIDVYEWMAALCNFSFVAVEDIT